VAIGLNDIVGRMWGLLRDACMAGDLGRVEAGDEPERQQSPVIGLHVGQRSLQIDQTDRVGRIAAGVLVQGVGDVDDRTTSLASDHLAGLVGRDGDQPRTHLLGVPQCVQSAPRDRPCRLDGVAGRLGITADDERDAGHGDAMLRDELRESRLVALGGEADRVRQKRCVLHGDTRHMR
jgi:hypothetical protein